MVVTSPAGGAIDGTHVVHFLSSDPGATLPADAFFAPGASHEDLVGRFATPGYQTITAVDAATGAVLARSTVAVQARRASASAGTIDAVYQTLLGHPADASSLARWEGRLNAGVSTGRLVLSLTRGVEYTQGQIAETYRRLLGRAPTAAEGNLAIAQYRASGSAVGVEKSLLGGGEYGRLQGGTTSAFLASLGRDVLGRDLTAAERSRLAARLAHGATRASVAGLLLATPAARNHRAAALFLDVLGRAPTTSEAAHVAAGVDTTAGHATAIARLVQTAEFRAFSTGPVALAPRPAASTVKIARAVPVANRFRALMAR